MVLDLEVLGDLCDRRALLVGVASDRQEKLVMRRCEPSLGRLLSTPPLEPAQARPEFEEPPIVVVTQVVHGVRIPCRVRRRRRWDVKSPSVS